MIAPHTARLLRVCASDSDDGRPTQALCVLRDCRILIDVEAGSSTFGAGTLYVAGVVMCDITDNSTIYTSSMPGHMGDLRWPTQKHTIRYDVPAAALSNREDHVCRVYAYLRTRAAEPDVSVGTSDLLFICP